MVAAENALECGEQVAKWGLRDHMLVNEPKPGRAASKIARYFNSAQVHLDHGRRIGFDECLGQGLRVERLEDNQDFQDEVLTTYHLMTIILEQSELVKFMRNNNGQIWAKNFRIPAVSA